MNLNFITKINDWIHGILHSASDDLHKLLPVAVGLVEGIKVVDDIAGDPVAALIGGVAIPFQAKFQAFLPKLLTEMRFLQVCDAVTPEQLKTAVDALIASLHNGVETQRQQDLTTIGAKWLQELYDGTLTFAEAVTMVEYDFKTILNK